MTSADSRTHGIHPGLILAVTGLAGLAYAMLSSAVIPALPSIQQSLHTTETGVTWLLTGYLLSASVATSIIGRLGDMYGKERLLIVTLVILSLGTVLSALSTSLAPMIVGRVIQGAGGGIFPLAFGIVRDEFPRERVAGGIGLLSAILGVGAGGSPSTFEAVGARLSERGARMDEMLEAIRGLLSQSNASFDGRYYRFQDVTIEPKPMRMPSDA